MKTTSRPPEDRSEDPNDDPGSTADAAAHLDGMTSPSNAPRTASTDSSTQCATLSSPHRTVSQALAVYDAEKRASVEPGSHPVDRSTTVGMCLVGDLARVLFTDTDTGRVRVLDMLDPAAVPVDLTFALLREAVVDAYDLNDSLGQARAADEPTDPALHHHPFVITDTDTLVRLANLAERWRREHGTQDARTLARLFTVRRTLPFSVFSPVLTESLASRYWLHADLDADSIESWSAAFERPTAHATQAGLAYLISLATTGSEINSAIQRAIVGGERYGAQAGQYGSDHAAASAFRKTGTLTDAHAAMVALDPLLRERNLIAGTVARVRVHQIKDDRVEAYLDDPGGIREGGKAWIFDDVHLDQHVELTLHRIEFVGDQDLMAVFSKPSARSRTGFLIAEAQKATRPLYAIDSPFLMIRKAPKNKRWTMTGEDAPKRTVDIPLDIALAGAPVGA